MITPHITPSHTMPTAQPGGDELTPTMKPYRRIAEFAAEIEELCSA